MNSSSQNNRGLPRQKSKFGKPLGFGTPDHFKGQTFSEKIAKAQTSFNPSAFKKTQHKG